MSSGSTLTRRPHAWVVCVVDAPCPRRQSARHATARARRVKNPPVPICDNPKPWMLNPSQNELEERLRTVCLLICATGVVCYGVAKLRFALVPLILSISLKYLLQPLIDCLSKKGKRQRLPHSVAVFIVLLLTLFVLATLALIITKCIRDVASRADKYVEQVQHYLHLLEGRIDPTVVTNAVLALGESLVSLLSTTMLVMVFTLYLPETEMYRREINIYLRGKILLSLLVGLLTAPVLAPVVDLWLAFSVLAFFANFVPNLGACISIILPMLGMHFNVYSLCSIATLIVIHVVIGNVVEPIFFGHSMQLHPIVVLLSLMIWSYLWGIPGLLLAVPITAILRIYLTSIDHPFASSLVNLLA